MTKQANVVSFPGKKASPPGDKPTPTKRADTTLIRECVILAQSLGAFNAGFTADPRHNSGYAGPLGKHPDARAKQAVAKISRMTASTPKGLQAKARIVPAIIHATAHVLEAREEAFFLSFAAEVQEFLESIIDEHRHADRTAKQGKVQS